LPLASARLEERVIKSQGIKDKNYATVVLRVIKIIIQSLPQNQEEATGVV
jgi:hypothetical protein